MLRGVFNGRVSAVRSVVVILAFTILCASQASAQVTGATLSGTVTDVSGAVIPNVQIAITDVGRDVTRTVTTDTDGFYTAPNLVPSTYQLTATLQGFATTTESGITLTVGAKQVLNIKMTVGEVSQKVEVTTEAPTVELTTSAVGNLVNSTTVVELPLNGRDWTQLATLVSGVNSIQTQVTGGFTTPRGTRGFGPQVTISGTRPQQNNYRQDGITITDYTGGAPGSVIGTTLGVDAVGEFSVLTSNYSSEYGRTSGGVINAVTRTGTNNFHGSAFWFIRDEGFDARGFFDASKLPPFHRNQFGGSVGGPIQKDKTFFFANFERFSQVLGQTNVNTVLSQNARNGIIAGTAAAPAPPPVSSCPAGTTLFVPGQSNICVNNLIIPYLPLWALPNAGLIAPGNTGLYNVVSTQAANENFITSRVDHKFSDKDNFSAVWSLDKANIQQPDVLDTVLGGNLSTAASAVLEETHVFSPTLVNTARIGYHKSNPAQNQPLAAILPIYASTALGVVPGQTAPGITVGSGVRAFGGGLGAASFNYESWDSYQGYDDAFLTKGTHSLKFGFAFEYDQHAAQNTAAANGSYTFKSLTQFLQNQPFSLKGPSGVYRSHLRQDIVAVYIQDDWRIRPNLTLNLGLRYETSSVPWEAKNNLSSFHNITDPAPTLGSPLILNPTRRNFEPRVGFAWDPFRNGKTSVRGAFGMFDVLPLTNEFFASEQNTSPFTHSIVTTNLPAGSFPALLTQDLANGVTSPNSQLESSFQFNPKRNYVMVWNLSIQRQLIANTTLTVAYVGNHGVHMFDRSDDGNDVLPVQYVNGTPLWPLPVGSGTKVNHFINGQFDFDFWKGSSEYDGLDVTFAKRFSHGFQGQVAYNWGKSLDTGSASSIADPYQNSLITPYWFCTSCMRGLSDFNVAQNLTINFIWDLPYPKDWGALVSHLTGGWEAGAIFTAHTGVPFTPLIAGDPLGLNSTEPLDFPNRTRGGSCQSPVNPGSVANYVNLSCFTLPVATPAIAAQCQTFGFSSTSAGIPGTCANLMGNTGRNSVIGPGYMGLDFSLFKNNYIKQISETFNVQFRAEFYNILNHANFATVVDNQTFFNQDGTPIAGAGAVDALVGTAREIQFGLKIIW